MPEQKALFKKEIEGPKPKEAKEKEDPVAEVTREDAAIFIEFDKRDEDQIKKELLGETITEFFYQFQQGSRTVTGISLKGINEIARRMGNIHIMEPLVKDKKDCFIVKVEVKDMLRNIDTWGIASQRKKMKFTEGGEKEDDFALQKAFSKARRNALRQLIPETWVTKLYEEWQRQKKAQDEQKRQDAKSFMPSK